MQQFLGRPIVKESFFRPILTVPQMPAVCSGIVSATGQSRSPLVQNSLGRNECLFFVDLFNKVNNDDN